MSTITTEAAQPAPAPTSQTPINLSIQDLQNLLIIVDLASQRGAFRAGELGQIGQIFDRVNAFVSSTIPAAEQSQQAQQAQQPAAETMMPQPVTASPMAPPFAPKIGV